MQAQDYDYTHSEAELEEMEALLIDSYSASRRPFNWRPALLENWSYASRYLEPAEYFTSRARLWRNGTGRLVGFVIRYYGITYPQIHPAYRWVEASIFDWAERNWAGDQARVHTLAFDHDSERQELLGRRGYVEAGPAETIRIYDLAKEYPEVPLPLGFRVATLAENGDWVGRIVLENAIWNAALDRAWFAGKSSAPHYWFDWDLLLISPEGKQVAACLVWIDGKNRMAEIDPLGTHPHYRGRGLARALVTDSFRRMWASGVRYAYIAASWDNEAANHLYGSLRPLETYQAHRWTKHLI
jgi:ribosomal protein S18 acetylase RimI-like enzyme